MKKILRIAHDDLVEIDVLINKELSVLDISIDDEVKISGFVMETIQKIEKIILKYNKDFEGLKDKRVKPNKLRKSIYCHCLLGGEVS